MTDKLLLLHGALGCQNQFKEIKTLLEKHFQVYTLDFSGHGDNSNVKTEFSMDVFVEDILHFLKKNKLEKVNIFGYSMGGYVALKFALAYPKKVEKIMTLATKVLWTPETAQKEVKMLNPEKMEEKIPSFVELLKKRHLKSEWKDVVLKTADLLQDLGNGRALEFERFIAIESPVKVCRGSKDTMVTEEESIELRNHLKKGEYHELKDCKHPFEQVNEEQLAEVIIRCFK